MAKSTCPVTRQQFLEHAQALTVTINNVPMLAEAREFATGSLGWYLNGKTVVEIDGKTRLGADWVESDRGGEQGVAEVSSPSLPSPSLVT